MAPPKETPHEALRAHALGFPESFEDFPWGERVVKVRKKVFVFLGHAEDKTGFAMSVKLPHTGRDALLLPFTEPTGYGLGKSGWVSVRLEDVSRVPVGLFREWIEESYRAVAPKKLAALLDEGPPASAPRKHA